MATYTRQPIPSDVRGFPQMLRPVCANFGVALGDTVRLYRDCVLFRIDHQPDDDRAFVQAAKAALKVSRGGIVRDDRDGTLWLIVSRRRAT